MTCWLSGCDVYVVILMKHRYHHFRTGVISAVFHFQIFHGGPDITYPALKKHYLALSSLIPFQTLTVILRHIVMLNPLHPTLPPIPQHRHHFTSPRIQPYLQTPSNIQMLLFHHINPSPLTPRLLLTLLPFLSPLHPPIPPLHLTIQPLPTHLKQHTLHTPPPYHPAHLHPKPNSCRILHRPQVLTPMTRANRHHIPLNSPQMKLHLFQALLRIWCLQSLLKQETTPPKSPNLNLLLRTEQKSLRSGEDVSIFNNYSTRARWI